MHQRESAKLWIGKKLIRYSSSQYCSQYNNNQHHSKNYQQTASLSSGALLIAICASKLDIRLPSIPSYILYIVVYRVKLSALLVHNVSNVSKQLIQFSDAGFDVPDLCLALDN